MGDLYPPPYEAIQSPLPGGVAYYPQAPPQPPAYSSVTTHQPYNQAGYSSATQQPYGHAGYPNAEPGPPAYEYPAQISCGQPQQTVVMPETDIVAQPTTVSMSGVIALSCCTFWCCGSLGGLIAFVLAMIGQSKASDGKVQSAIQLRDASYVASIVGIVLGFIINIVVFFVVVRDIFTRFADHRT